MGTRKCLYCDSFISESTPSCPYCKNSEPFNEQKKEKKIFEEKGKKELERKLNEYVKCKDCGHLIRKSDIWKSDRTIMCPKCGFPDIKIECFVCGDHSRYFDPYQENFTCYKHYSESCSICRRFVKGINKRVEVGYRSQRPFCESCYNKKQTIEFWKEFPVSFILRPIGFGLAFFFLLWIIGSVIRIILGNNIFKSIDNAFSVEGFIGFFFGFIWAILKRKELD